MYNLIHTKDSQIPVHQIGTMQQKSVNFLWTAQTKLTCKNYFSNNLQEVKWVMWIFSAKEKKRMFVILWIFGKRFYFIQGICIYTPTPQRGRGVYCFTSVRLSVQDNFRRIFLSNCWWQKSDIWSQASYSRGRRNRWPVVSIFTVGPVKLSKDRPAGPVDILGPLGPATFVSSVSFNIDW